jgi:hypothetical protein
MLHEVIDRLHQLSNQQSLSLVEPYDNNWDDKENGIEMVMVYDATMLPFIMKVITYLA